MHLSSIINISSLKDNKLLLMILIEIENRSHIAAPITIIRGRPNRDEAFVKVLLVAFHDELMRPENAVDVVFVIEFFDDVFAEQKASASWRDFPVDDCVVWVGPHDVAHCSLVWDFLFAVEAV